MPMSYYTMRLNMKYNNIIHLNQAAETAKALGVGKCLLAIPAARGSACRNIGSQMYDDMSRFRQHINTPTYERTSVYFWSSPESDLGERPQYDQNNIISLLLHLQYAQNKPYNAQFSNGSRKVRH